MKSIQISNTQSVSLIEGSIAIHPTHNADVDSIFYIEPKPGSCFGVGDLQEFAQKFGAASRA